MACYFSVTPNQGAPIKPSPISSLKFLTLSLIFSASVHTVYSATYYVATNGNDANTASQAQTLSTPWKTIQHAANNMAAGDVCLIRGGTYRETIIVPKSGTASAPLTFKAYGTEVPVISGADAVSGWALKKTNIYEATASSLFVDSGSTQVFMNGAMKPEARWPNVGPGYPWIDLTVDPSPDLAYADSAGYNSSNQAGWITDAALPTRASGYWTGASLHCYAGYSWLINNSTITAYDSTTKKITTDDSNSDHRYTFTAGNGYYITGKIGELDSNGEWFYTPSTSTLSFYSTSGAPTGIEAKKRQYGFDLSGRAYINLTGLHFFACTIKSDKTSSYCTFDKIYMKYLSHSENSPASCGLTLWNHFVLKNSELGWDARGLITLAGSDIKIINNHLHDSGYVPTKRAMIYSAGANGCRNLISHNSMHDAGMAILHSPGVSSIVEYNDMYNAVKLCKDNGIVYVANTDGGNVIFRYNLLHHAPGGVGEKGAPNHGIYIDNLNSGWIIYHNIVWDVPNKGILLNRRHAFHMVFNNDFYGKTGGTTGGYFEGPTYIDGESGIHFYNNLFRGNPQRDMSDTDTRFNAVDDPSYVDPANGDFRLQSSSIARDKGIIIPGVTDGYVGSAPDMGAIEYGGTDWRQNVGYKSTPISPEPTYTMPDMIFSNKIKDGGFESGSLAPNWTAVSGSAVSFQTTLWRDDHIRTQYASLKFNPGTSEIRQTVTGLLPNHRYKLYVGVQNFSSSNSAKFGVRNFGRTSREMSSPLSSASDAFVLNNIPFVTGPTATSADVYVHITIPSGGSPVYVDDVGLELSEDMDPQYGSMPLIAYPFNESSATVATDASTHGRNGTIIGSGTMVSGLQGNSLKLNGTTTYVTTPTITTPTDEITVACWAKSSASTWNSSSTFIGQKPSFTFGGTAGSRKVTFMYHTASGDVYYGFTPVSTVDITGWHHYVATYSMRAGVKAMYLDGQLIQSSVIDVPVAIVPTTSAIAVGKDSVASTHYFSGQLDDVRLYDKALQQEEVQALYKLDKTLAVRLSFDDNAGSTKAWDCSGSGRNGTLNGFDTSTAWVKGKIGGALSFNGTSTFVSTPGMSTPSSLTVGCWAKSATSTWNADGCILSKEPSFVLSPVKGTRNMSFTIKVGGVAKTATFTAPTGFDASAWHQYVGTYSPSSGNLNLYVDGAVQNSVTGISGNPDADTGGLLVGKNKAGVNYLAGQVDEVQVYGRELNASDVLDLSLRTYGPYDSSSTSTVTSNSAPTANAGADQTLILAAGSTSISTTLDGSESTDGDGSISTYLWSQSSGPSTASFSSTSSKTPTLSGLIKGTYTFQLKVTDNGSASATDSVNVTVSAASNVAPISNAGPDQTLTLSSGATSTSTALNGSGSKDSDGSISTYAWTKVSGPSGGTFSSTSVASPSVSGLLQGIYKFRLTVTDNVGATASDDVQVTVNQVHNYLIDVGASARLTPTTSGKYWNNLTSGRAGNAITGMVDINNKASTIGFSVVDPFYQVTLGQANTNGTTVSTIYPSTATVDSFFIGTLSGTTVTSAKVRLSGLSTSSATTYKVKLYASRNATDLTDRTTIYTINGVSKELQARNNVDGYVVFDQLTATNGAIDIGVGMKTGSAFGYLGIVDVTETSH